MLVMKLEDMQEFEVNQLLEAINFRYGYDFRDYSKASLERRILHRMQQSELNSISEMLPKVMHDPDFFALFLRDMSVTVTEMFRDPNVFHKLRQEVFTQLKTYSRVNIWHAGCATGEEVYSMAIMLKEEGLLDRTRIYATDYNNHSLDIAEKGIYSADKMQLYTQNYLAAGGTSSFADYYQAKFGSVKIIESLKQHITFANHNLMKDQCFAEMHLVVCRNVLIYFNPKLQDRVLSLFKESLISRGFLLLGDKETLEFSQVSSFFEAFSHKERIFRRLIHV
ncbi:protein-glutamate O-methyltransferase CheR [Shewanella sp. VB17]|uniref:CheR family methyltransferase n=1 Tax=Shewanella sp. VB17 TaxID=2739432 RepID=UPI001566A209|nr:protein-glutamate O-methyltransferase CheR [Shewanella sp. VB17]NRD74460.1 protein-glutamate O-methyltransferase CheR [Shewanella sp. VB17]